MAISEPASKRIKLGSEEVCVILSPVDFYSDYFCCLYFVDLHEESATYTETPQRSIRINGRDGTPKSPSLALSNSSLFVFGGYKELRWSPKVFHLDLSPYLDITSSAVDLPFESLKEIAPMQSGKFNGYSVLLGARICVFSLLLKEDLTNFELFDPKAKKWLPFPDFPIKSTDDSTQVVVNYYAIDDCTLFIHTDFGSYSIDTESDDPKDWEWSHLDDLPSLKLATGGAVVKSSSLFLTSHRYVYDVASAAVKELCRYNFPAKNGVDLKSTHVFLPRHDDIVALNRFGTRSCIAEAGLFGTRGTARPGDVERGHLRLSLVEFGDSRFEGPKTVTNFRTLDLGEDFLTSVIFIKGIFPFSSPAVGMESTAGGK